MLPLPLGEGWGEGDSCSGPNPTNLRSVPGEGMAQIFLRFYLVPCSARILRSSFHPVGIKQPTRTIHSWECATDGSTSATQS